MVVRTRHQTRHEVHRGAAQREHDERDRNRLRREHRTPRAPDPEPRRGHERERREIEVAAPSTSQQPDDHRGEERDASVRQAEPEGPGVEQIDEALSVQQSPRFPQFGRTVPGEERFAPFSPGVPGDTIVFQG